MWLCAGGIAFVVAIANLILAATGKYKYCSIFVFVSLSSGLLAMSSSYSMVNEWVKARDMSALMDVVPTMDRVLFIAACLGICLNAIAVLMNGMKVKK